MNNDIFWGLLLAANYCIFSSKIIVGLQRIFPVSRLTRRPWQKYQMIISEISFASFRDVEALHMYLTTMCRSSTSQDKNKPTAACLNEKMQPWYKNALCNPTIGIKPTSTIALFKPKFKEYSLDRITSQTTMCNARMTTFEHNAQWPLYLPVHSTVPAVNTLGVAMNTLCLDDVGRNKCDVNEESSEATSAIW